MRRVEQGETIEITDRGRPVARVAPLPAGRPLDRLRAAGEVDAATAARDQLPPPLVLPPGVASPAAALARLRRDER